MPIRTAISVVILLVLWMVAAPARAASTTVASSVEQWDIFELPLSATPTGNPFAAKLSAKFIRGASTIEVRGFYDGDGVFKIRFMPSEQGVWKYETASDLPELAGKTGEFTCLKPSASNHGPVGVRNMFHFAFADGTPFVPISTTLYGWVNQRSTDLQDQTLATLKASPFNRIRMMLLPIKYGDDNVPLFFPFVDRGNKDWDFEHLEPRFFQNIEKRLTQLRDMGIEAELILFHSRDSGLTRLDRMPPEADDRYLRYNIARLAAYRNITWNLANEFDAMRTKRDEDWDRFFQIIEAEDPFRHPRSVHQMRRYYDAAKPWVTHMSVQSELALTGFGRPVIYRQLIRKPVIFDEVQYEGDIPQSWGHLTGEEMTERFWMGTIGGTYVTHGETYQNAPGVAWISRGGKLVGESPKRIAFLKEILSTAPPEGLTPIEPELDKLGIAGKPGEYYLVYFGHEKPTEWTLRLPAARPGTRFRIEVIDTWNMTITPIEQPAATGADPAFKVTLPGKPYMALRIRRAQ